MSTSPDSLGAHMAQEEKEDEDHQHDPSIKASRTV
jgi:hypothetical protein